MSLRLLFLYSLLGVSVFLQFISISSCQSSNKDSQSVNTPAVEEHPNVKLLPKNCGIVYEVRVVGGNKPKVFEFPWMAHLLFNTSSSAPTPGCSGTIINERYILTAAVCFIDLLGIRPTSVRVGEHDASQQTDCGDNKACTPPYQDIAIEEVVQHPENDAKENLIHDVALIRLASPIDFSRMNAVPICIPHLKTYREKSLNNTELWISEWTVTKKGKQTSHIISKKIPYVPNDRCAQMYKAHNGLDVGAHQMCAGGFSGEVGCTGDSGEPLQGVEYFDEQQRYVQYGIVSFISTPCGPSEYPSVYTRVSYYIKWILDTIKP